MDQRSLYALHPIYQRFWRDIGSQAYTEMKLKPEHYYRREKKSPDLYFCFCGCGSKLTTLELIGKKINCYSCKKEFIFKDWKFPIKLVCSENCRGGLEK